ncbi:hypothetical protein [Actinomadura flavalba]|uniref:hypothetical protein n=1 Tax=Actinomadura flavalba TaxID=1120938 RepID=UPI00037DEBFB|nr:hypothetical protein [Actinomadura flavalba]
MVRWNPLGEADLEDLFGRIPNQAEVGAVLHDADAVMRRLAQRFGLWEHAYSNRGYVLELVTPPCLVSVVEAPGDTVYMAELQQDADFNGWRVTARVEVRCTTTGECGYHVLATWPDSGTTHYTPLDAAHALVRASGWVDGRAAAARPRRAARRTTLPCPTL